MKYLLLVSLMIFCSCHSGSSKKGTEDQKDSICLQKELYALHQYVDSIIKIDTILQQRFHCFGAGLTKDKVSIDFQDIPEDSFEVFKSAFKKEIVDSPLLEFNIMTDFTTDIEIIPMTETKQPSQTASFVLQPIPRKIPTGEPISPDSLSMQAEFNYYPLSTTEVKIIITNRSHNEYNCGEKYSLAYYNEKQNSWISLPTNPIVNDILWIFPSEHSIHEQTIKLYTSEVPNRVGKYRIYKAFNRNTKVAYAEFELVSSKEHRKLLDKIIQYSENHAKARVIVNLNSWGFKENDTLYMNWKVNSAELRNEFKQKVLNYSTIMVNDGEEDVVTYFNNPMCTDTFGIKMYAEKEVYPVNMESVTVRIVNRSGKTITTGTWYAVLQKEKDDKWIFMPGATVWAPVALSVQPNTIHSFSANLYPSLNAIMPGVYRIVKKIEIGNNCHDWYFAAEFRIGNDTEKQDDVMHKEPSSKPLSEMAEETNMDIAYEVVEKMPEYPGGMSALLDFIQNNLQHDKANSKQRVIVQFIIDKEGNIDKPIILRSINPELDKEALRVVGLIPQWKPGRQNGKAERVRYTLPITFNPSITRSDVIK